MADGVLQSHRKNNLVKFDLFVINFLRRWLFFSLGFKENVGVVQRTDTGIAW